MKWETLSFADEPRSHIEALNGLFSGNTTCLLLQSFICEQTSARICARLMEAPGFLPHQDVPGLQVLGLSHFQAVRDPEEYDRYTRFGRTLRRTLHRIAAPEDSPFEKLLDYLSTNTGREIKKLSLEGEQELAPFTVRACNFDVGIEPHQDILSAESPSEMVAKTLVRQFAVNVFLSAADEGGYLEIFDLDPSATGYENLDDGPKTVALEILPEPEIVVRPKTGDLIVFDSTFVHRVVENRGSSPRITLSCFLATTNEEDKLHYWV